MTSSKKIFSIPASAGILFASLMKTADRGLLYGMPLAGTACATREFAHAQTHPSGFRPHAEQTRRELAEGISA